MTDPQELANEIGAGQRQLEAALAASDLPTARTCAAEQHQRLTAAYAWLRDHGGIVLDWDPIAGNTATKAGGAHTNGGGPKQPPQED